MNYKTHITGGLCLGAATYTLVSNKVMMEPSICSTLGITFIATSVIGALISDIDHPGSYLGKKFPIISKTTSAMFGHRGITHSPIIVSLLYIALFMLKDILVLHNDYLQLVIGALLIPIGYLVVDLLGNYLRIRKGKLIFLKLIMIGMLTMFTIHFSSPALYLTIITGVFIGELSHLFLDYLTKGGIPLFYPFSKRKFSLNLTVTGSKLETLIRSILIAVFFVLIGTLL